MGSSPAKEKPSQNGGISNVANSTEQPLQTVDPRLPFDNYRQLFMIKNNWKAIRRDLDDVAKDNLLRFFKNHPEHKHLWGEKYTQTFTDEALLADDDFENAALNIFGVFDDVMKNIEQVDLAIGVLRKAGKFHTNIAGFNIHFFKQMEASFLAAVQTCLGERWKDSTERNFVAFYGFILQELNVGFES